MNLASLDSLDRIILTVKDSGWSFVNHHLFHNRRAFYHTSIGSKVPFQNSKPSRLTIWIVNRSYDFWILIDASGNIFLYCFSGHS